MPSANATQPGQLRRVRGYSALLLLRCRCTAAFVRRVVPLLRRHDSTLLRHCAAALFVCCSAAALFRRCAVAPLRCGLRSFPRSKLTKPGAGAGSILKSASNPALRNNGQAGNKTEQRSNEAKQHCGNGAEQRSNAALRNNGNGAEQRSNRAKQFRTTRFARARHLDRLAGMNTWHETCLALLDQSVKRANLGNTEYAGF